ncbi:hypothetical protein LOD99_5637 [Oopsacas minuta]|uniref:DNA mismatch repair protein MutS core domain-containing protein n=1 Tax=Oopsacas minuta TaxID=111878 RepID=A0AAV7JQ60_9METZ|nr:hypothetical protein LOD99_5637 [Oopsacas minuta]
MEIMDNSPSQSRFFSKKLQSKTLNTSTNHNASSPTSTPIPNRFCTSAGVGLSPSITPNAQSSLAKFQCSFNISQNSEVSTLKCESLADSIMNITQNIEYMHEKQTWLQSTKIKDKEGRKPTDPDYNPKSLYVPPEFIAMKTPAQKQWWEIKSQNFDTILIFKVGKFYELYHMDAVIAVRELGLSFMKGEIAHCGFPEVAFARFAETLVDRGFKIARVEQTETPKQMEQRNKTQGHSSKVVRREVCSIESKGTKNYSSLSGELLPMDTTQYLYAITCRELNHNEVEVGFCFIDTQIGTFHIGQFINDRHLSSLRTLLSHYPPAQLLYEKNRLPQSVLFLLQLYPGVVFDPLIPGKEFWDVSNTLKYLTESKYLGSSFHEWPTPIKSLLSPNSSLGLSARSEGEMAVSCLGAVIWCLVRCKLEKNILSLKRIEIHNPHDSKTAGSIGKNNSLKYLVLDATALHNLDVIDASGDTSKTKGTLLYTIDQCASGMGKRLLRQWICNPLTNPKDIIKRQEAIQELIRLKPEMNQLKKILKSIPDLERLLRKIHTFGVHKPNDDHPDCRAVLYEETIYNKRKIHDFVNCLNGLRSSLEITELFLPILPELNSLLLLKLLTSEIDCNDSTIVNINTLSLDESGNENNIAPTDSTQSLKELIEYFDNSFVAEEARKSGKILPLPGVDIEYDRAKEDIKEVEKSLENYLSEQKKRIGNSKIKYWYGGKMRYQIEISEDFLKKTRQPDDYTLVSQKKGIRRFMTPTVKRLLEDMIRVEERRDKAIKGTMVNLFRSFDQHFTRWEKVVSNIATIDALCSLAIFSGASDGPMCIPEFLPNTQKPTLRILDGRHPTLCRVVESGNFIPNDIILGGKLKC